MGQKTRAAAKEKIDAAKRKKSLMRDILEIVIPALLIFLIVRAFFFESRWVPSPSMIPTIDLRDRFLENKLVYRFRAPRRGEIIVFHPPALAIGGAGKSSDFVKRVVGLPGETIDIRAGKVYVNGALLAEPYIAQENMDYLSFGPYRAPEGHLFVMGDNRRQSRDSRYWLYVPIKNVDGKAFWRYWPLNHISVLR